MASVRPGHRPVMMVVDVQVGVMAEAWQAPRVVDNIARVVERARAQGVPVIWVQHENPELQRDTPAWQWVAELVPADGDVRVHKRYNSAFEQTTLDDELARLGATHIVLAGAATNWCIRATAYGALDRGYDLTLVGDAHTTGDLDLGDGTVIRAEAVIPDLNTAMNWLRYPGRGNRVATADAVDFGSAPAPQG